MTSVAAGGTAAFGELAASLREAIARGDSLLAEVTGPLAEQEAISNAAVLMFGGIETTEGMIANALLHLLSSPAQLALVLADPGLVPAAVEESLRLSPAAVVDRYATVGTRLGDTAIQAGDQVTVSITGANRDPRCSPTRTCSTCAGPTPGATWPLRTARISAWARTWPGSRRRSPSGPCWPAPPAAAGSRLPERTARPGLPQAPRPAGAVGYRLIRGRVQFGPACPL